MAGPGSNQVGQGNSNKNTLLNGKPSYGSTLSAYGATAGTPSPADPSTYGGYAAQVMGLQQQLAGAMALAKSGIGAARGQFMLDAQAARTARIQGVTGAESDAGARGIIGSSGDLAARGAAVAAAGALRQQAVSTRNNAIAGVRTGQIQAVGQFYTGLGAAQSSLANQQAMQNIARYQADAFDVYNQNFSDLQKSILARLNNRGRIRDIAPGYGVPPSGTGGDYAAQAYTGKPLY